MFPHSRSWYYQMKFTNYTGQDPNRNQESVMVISMRENYAKICIETSLQYSLLERRGDSEW